MKLRELQRRMAEDVMRPVTASDHIARHTETGEPMSARAASYIKPNDRLTSLERLELYNRQYWYRVLDSLYEDFPGLRAIVGERAFTKLSEAYLQDCPSQSFTLRELGSRLEGWLRDHPEYAGKDSGLAIDMVRLEWAHIEAFDGEELKEIGPEDLAEFDPHMKVRLQPYVRLLALGYPVDDLRIRVKRHAEEHAAASNAVTAKRHSARRRSFSGIAKATVFVAVHRNEGDVYYRRLEAAEYGLLKLLEPGDRLEAVLTRAVEEMSAHEIQKNLERWFAAWARLGWLCHSARKREREG